MIAEQAPAKVNLTLSVVGRRADGLHELESLVVFADFGDALTIELGAASGSSIELDATGRFADELRDQSDGLRKTTIHAAVELFGRRNVKAPAIRRISIDKQIPLAAGLGGGSADAAAVLRALGREAGGVLDMGELSALAAAIGADAPACIHSRPLMMSGIGEVIAPLDHWPTLHAVLVNPGLAAPTRDVFARHAGSGAAFSEAGAPPPTTRQAVEALAYIDANKNDLTVAAIAVAPPIADALHALETDPACRIARMTGSGATCFGLFDSADGATDAAARIAADRPRWWVRACTLLGTGEAV